MDEIYTRATLDRRGAGVLDDWERDNLRMGVAIRTAAQLLVDHRERAVEQERRIRDAAIRQGHEIDTRADYAAGSAAAYAIACSTLAGAMRVARIEELTGRDWHRERGPERPVLPSEITEPERTTVVGSHLQHIDDQRGDHFAGMPEPES